MTVEYNDGWLRTFEGYPEMNKDVINFFELFQFIHSSSFALSIASQIDINLDWCFFGSFNANLESVGVDAQIANPYKA